MQNLLDGILRHPLRGFGKARIAAFLAGKGVFDGGERAAVERRREHHVGWIVVRQRRRSAQRFSQTPAPHMLHGANIGGLGARLRAGARTPFDHGHRDAAQTELDGERQPDRTRADNKDLRSVDLSHVPRLFRSSFLILHMPLSENRCPLFRDMR